MLHSYAITLAAQLEALEDILPKLETFIEQQSVSTAMDLDNFRLRRPKSIGTIGPTFVYHGKDLIRLEYYKSFFVEQLTAAIDGLPDDHYTFEDKEVIWQACVTSPERTIQLQQVRFDKDTQTSYRVNVFWKHFYWMIKPADNEDRLYLQEYQALYKPDDEEHLTIHDPLPDMLRKIAKVAESCFFPIVAKRYLHRLHKLRKNTEYTSNVRFYIQRVRLSCTIEASHLLYTIVIDTPFGNISYSANSEDKPRSELVMLQRSYQREYDSEMVDGQLEDEYTVNLLLDKARGKVQ